MKKQLLCIALLGAVSFTACVPAKKFNDLKKNYDKALQENAELSDALSQNKQSLTELRAQLEKLKDKQAALQAAQRELQRKKDLLQGQYDGLQKSYKALEKHSSAALKANSEQNRALLDKIEKKQQALSAEQARLQKMKDDLASRSKRIEELEAAISAKENQMKALKDKISAALTDFEGKGLHVHRKNGKVYVSMENKLLFKSGSWAVNAKGQQALHQLAAVLAQNPDIHVLIEGHTDNVPYRAHGLLKDNWDLSTKRATAVVRIILENKGINPKSLTAAGRSKYAPIAPNTTATGRAKNRRIEVILTPELSKITKLLQQTDE